MIGRLVRIRLLTAGRFHLYASRLDNHKKLKRLVRGLASNGSVEMLSARSSLAFELVSVKLVDHFLFVAFVVHYPFHFLLLAENILAWIRECQIEAARGP